MASALTVAKFFDRALVQMWDHDPDSTAASITTPDAGTTKRVVDLRDYGGFAVIAQNSTLTGNGLTKLEIVASEDSAGSTNLTVIKDSGTLAGTTVGKGACLECTAEELTQLGANLRYVAARLTVANSADECNVTYIRHTPRFAASALTAATF